MPLLIIRFRRLSLKIQELYHSKIINDSIIRRQKLIKQLPQQLLALSLLLLPITYFLAPTATVSFFPSYLIGLFGLVVIILQLDRLLPTRRSLVLILIFCFTMLVSIHVAEGQLLTTAKYLGYVTLIITFVLGIFIAAEILPWFLNTFMTVIVGAALVSCLFSIGFFFLLDYQPLVEPRLYALGRLQNPVISAISYGSILCLCMSLIATTKEKGLRVLTLCVGIVLTTAIVLTGSRGVWLGLMSALTAIILLKQWRNRQQLALSLSIFVSIVVLITLALFFSGYSDAITRRSFSFRPEIWRTTIQHWLDGNLLLGSGLNTVINLNIPPRNFLHPHSIYISTLYYGGVIGFTGFLILIARLFWVLVKSADSETRAFALPLFVFGITVLSFDGNKIIEKVDFLWWCFWLPVALTLIAEARRKNHPPAQ